ncbi:hypothetical protein ACTQKJ_05790 [Eggerthellaceae bacterium PR-HUZ602407-17]
MTAPRHTSGSFSSDAHDNEAFEIPCTVPAVRMKHARVFHDIQNDIPVVQPPVPDVSRADTVPDASRLAGVPAVCRVSTTGALPRVPAIFADEHADSAHSAIHERIQQEHAVKQASIPYERSARSEHWSESISSLQHETANLRKLDSSRVPRIDTRTDTAHVPSVSQDSKHATPTAVPHNSKPATPVAAQQNSEHSTFSAPQDIKPHMPQFSLVKGDAARDNTSSQAVRHAVHATANSYVHRSHNTTEQVCFAARLVSAQQTEASSARTNYRSRATRAMQSAEGSAPAAQTQPARTSHLRTNSHTSVHSRTTSRLSTRSHAASRSHARSNVRPRANDTLHGARFIITGSLVVLVLVTLISGIFAWNRWWRFNDVQDIQGEWVVQGSSVSVFFTNDKILLTKKLPYDYKIDPVAKTLTFSFGKFQGSGRYMFRHNRTQLVILDGATFSPVSTLRDDIDDMLHPDIMDDIISQKKAPVSVFERPIHVPAPKE